MLDPSNQEVTTQLARDINLRGDYGLTVFLYKYQEPEEGSENWKRHLHCFGSAARSVEELRIAELIVYRVFNLINWASHPNPVISAAPKLILSCLYHFLPKRHFHVDEEGRVKLKR